MDGNGSMTAVGRQVLLQPLCNVSVTQCCNAHAHSACSHHTSVSLRFQSLLATALHAVEAWFVHTNRVPKAIRALATNLGVQCRALSLCCATGAPLTHDGQSGNWCAVKEYSLTLMSNVTNPSPPNLEEHFFLCPASGFT